MTNKIQTKRALISSVVALILCFAMLLGSTFAWLTDSVVSDSNKIVAGNLAVKLYHYDDVAGADAAVEKDTKLFDNVVFWEPGAMVWEKLTVANAGSLSFKYKLTVEIANISFVGGKSLADVLKVVVMQEQPTRENVAAAAKRDLVSFDLESDKALDAGAVDDFYVAIYWEPSEKDNDYNVPGEALYAYFNVALVATQNALETDGFSDNYDTEAAYPTIDKIVDHGTYGGIDWTLTESGKLTIAPAAVPAPDANSGAAYEVGAWREAVVYDSKGDAKAIGGYPYDVNAVKSLVIEEGVTSIGSFTAKFPKLTGEVVIPSTVTYIGQEAFQNAPITKLTFAAGGTGALCIGPGAFKQLAIEEVELPADRSEIHVHCWAFNDCKSLKQVTFPANITTFANWTHVDYCGMEYVDGWDSQILARCSALETITFGSQAVNDLFFAAAGNTGNINSIGNVEIVVVK